MSREQDLIATLPEPLAKGVHEAMAQPDPENFVTTRLWDEVFAMVEWPNADAMIPLCSELDSAQRAVAEIVAARPGTYLPRWAIPGPSWSKRRWLELEPPGALERLRAGDEPVWRSLHAVRRDSGRIGEILCRFSLAERLEALCEMGIGAYRFETGLSFVPWGKLEEINDHGCTWAPAFADFLLDIFREGVPGTERSGQREPDILVRQIISACLVRSGLSIEARWDSLLILSEECMRALPEPRRNDAIMASISTMFPDEVIATALSLLPAFPFAELTRAALERSDRGNRPQAAVLSDLESVAARHAVVRQELDAYLAARAAAPELRCRRVIRPRTTEELTAVQRDQIVVVGRLYDGRDLPADQRMGSSSAEAFHTIEIREIADASGKPAYDAYICNGDSGSIFRAGTTEEVAAIIQFGVQCADAPLREGLKLALMDKARAKKGGGGEKPARKNEKAAAKKPPRGKKKGGG